MPTFHAVAGTDAADGQVTDGVMSIFGDRITGLGGNDRIYGYGGDDTIEGGFGDDVIFDLKSWLSHSAGSDTILGGSGNDTIFGGEGADVINGGADTDTVTYQDSAAAVRVNLRFESPQEGGDAEGDLLFNIESLTGSRFSDVLGGSHAGGTVLGLDGNDIITGGSGRNLLDGGTGNDNIFGGAEADVILGGSGNDTLNGYFGTDTIDGGSGRDRITGGSGGDRMTGGTDADVFVFAAASDSRRGAGTFDTITDFSRGSDRIDLSAVDANGHVAGNQAFVLTAGFRGAGSLVVTQEKGQTVVTGHDDRDGIADFAFVLTGSVSLTASDFLL